MSALIISLFLPLLGSIALLFFKKENTKAIKTFTLLTTILTFVVSLALIFGFDSTNPDFQFVTLNQWIPSIDAGFRVGLDGMSLLLVMLTTFLTPLVTLNAFDSIHKREKEFYIMLLLLEFGMIGVFAALDLFLFYIFWEVILIPMYFMIGIWGGKDRLYATIKFFLFTVVGSLFMLIAIVWLGSYAGTELLHLENGFTTNYLLIKDVSQQIPLDIQQWMFLAFALSFLIKVPLFPLHTWLPDAHTQAPTPGSIILAGVLLKMGTYGLIRFNLELFPQSSFEWAGVISALAVIGIIYGALVAMVQTDIKKLVAYSSVSHLGFVVLGIFSMTAEGIQGAIIQMIAHGLSTGMLFMLVGVVYERRHTREIADYGGIARTMPKYATMFLIALMASVGLPGLAGFVGEFATIFGAFQSKFLDSVWYSVFAASGVIFAAVYLLWMYKRVFFGTNDNPKNHNLADLTRNEWIQMIPLVFFMVWIGFYSVSFTSISETSTRKLVNKLEMLKFGSERFEIPSLKSSTNETKK